jgi:hypothetical protein
LLSDLACGTLGTAPIFITFARDPRLPDLGIHRACSAHAALQFLKLTGPQNGISTVEILHKNIHLGQEAEAGEKRNTEKQEKI